MGEQEVWFWIWVVLAAGLIIAEIFTAAFFMAAFGISATVAAVLAWYGVDASWQLGAFLGVAIPLLFVARMLTQRARPDVSTPVAADRLLGSVGIVAETIRPHGGGGRVRVGSEEWAAQAEDGSEVAAGTEIDVLRVEGVRLVVRPRGH